MKTLPQFEKSAADSGFNRAKWLSESGRDFVMCEMPKESQFDRLSLIGRKIVQDRSHTRYLIILVRGIRRALAGGCIGGFGSILYIFSRTDHHPQTPATR